MIYARQSTAIIFIVGPVLDASGVAVTGSVIADFKLSKNGGAPAAFDASATLTHRHTGYYSLSATATDVNTVGTAEVTCDDTVNACPMKEIQVVEPVVYDALFADAATGYALASVVGALADAAVDGDPTTSDTVMQYIKQIVNTLCGSAGIPTYPAAAVAGNAVSLAEVIRSIDTRLPAALVSARMSSDVIAIASSTLGATLLAAMFSSAQLGTVDNAGFTPTTTQFEIDDIVDEPERYQDQAIFWVTGANAGITSKIVAYAYPAGVVRLTVNELPATVSDNETFIKMGRIL